MQIHIYGHSHFKVTKPIENYVLKKFGKLEIPFKNITHIHLTLGVNKKFQHYAKAQLALARSKGRLFAEAEEEDLYTAIDILYGHLHKEVLRHKEKLKDRRRNSNLLDLKHFKRTGTTKKYKPYKTTERKKQGNGGA